MEQPDAKRRLTIFTLPGCGRCRAAGEFFSGLGLDIEWVDVSASMSARRRMLSLAPGNKSVPVIVWGQRVEVGFDPAAWDDLKGILR